MATVGMTVTFKAINGEKFTGTIVESDRYGFTVVNLGMSEARIATSELAVA
jgi:DNA-directed RNA polymerase subunit E'/Rpb7